ncbi:aminotransferase class I/II-fold pyridoxal phosphate-dependent enzyme [Fluviispira sanaruensis]|uniref:8-amino-7-oxononanoate synthase n=1 Tax=Fluviispira sanaruensis TaxID=2493639 RepID=A0A4V0P2R4_FLUSA|nr:aminotransferase class I/II-fold pyridoxal phosphate-dependent enzyme [Fluviispira sanaruensis]BBH54137.1 8-amino-7-oxononanoate synthase [Fluviispira sanaruensis]
MSTEYLNKIWQSTNSALIDQHNYRKPIRYYKNKSEQKINIDFSTNDYLGMRFDPRVIDAGYQAAQDNGAGSGSSRMVIETDANLLELENYFSKCLRLEHSLYFSSGFMANLALFDAISPYSFEENIISQELFVDHRCHASIYLGFRNAKIPTTIFRHMDFKNLAQKLKNSSASAKIIVIESLFSMDGDVFSATELAEICAKYNAFIIIDETHSIGVLPSGSYLAANYFLKKYVIAIVAGCGKALGVSGGFIATDYSALKQRVMQKSKALIYSTAATPFAVGALLQSLKIIFSEEGQLKRDKLYGNINYFKNRISLLHKNKICQNIYELNNHCSHIIPLIVGDNAVVLKMVQSLLERGILVKEIRPPSVPRGTARLRVILRSDHSKKDIDDLFENIF